MVHNYTIAAVFTATSRNMLFNVCLSKILEKSMLNQKRYSNKESDLIQQLK